MAHDEIHVDISDALKTESLAASSVSDGGVEELISASVRHKLQLSQSLSQKTARRAREKPSVMPANHG